MIKRQVPCQGPSGAGGSRKAVPCHPSGCCPWCWRLIKRQVPWRAPQAPPPGCCPWCWRLLSSLPSVQDTRPQLWRCRAFKEWQGSAKETPSRPSEITPIHPIATLSWPPDGISFYSSGPWGVASWKILESPRPLKGGHKVKTISWD